MSRRKKDPLRPLTDDELRILEQLAMARSEPAVHVARAKALLAVADGATYVASARLAGLRSGDTVAAWVARFNREGLAALSPRYGGGPCPRYGPVERARILAEAQRFPDRERDGTATWSLTTLQRALRHAPDGLPEVSTYTIWVTLREAGYSWQRTRSWCTTGTVKRQRKSGIVEVTEKDALYKVGESLGLVVWCHDQAGPFQTLAYPGISRQPVGQPVCQSHEYIRAGTAKLLTLFHPASGHVRACGVTACPNPCMAGWKLKKSWLKLRTLRRSFRSLPFARCGQHGMTASLCIPRCRRSFLRYGCC